MKKIFMVLSVVTCSLAMAGMASAIQMASPFQITETVTNSWNDLKFDVYNEDSANGVYSFIIGAAIPVGTASAGGNSGWNAKNVSIQQNDDSSSSYNVCEQGGNCDAPIFKLTDDEWSGYSQGYFYYTDDNPISLDSSLTVYAFYAVPASPFAFTNYKYNPNSVNIPTGYGTTQSGNSPVPEPSTILLMATGLLGLLGYSRKRSKMN